MIPSSSQLASGHSFIHQTSAILFGSKCGSIYHFFLQVTLLDYRRPIRWISQEEIDRKVIFGSLPVIRTSRLNPYRQRAISSWNQIHSHTLQAKWGRNIIMTTKSRPISPCTLRTHQRGTKGHVSRRGGLPAFNKPINNQPTMTRNLQHLPAHLQTPIGSTATFQPNRGGKDNLDAVKKNLTMCTPCESEFILNSAGSMLTPRLTFS